MEEAIVTTQKQVKATKRQQFKQRITEQIASVIVSKDVMTRITFEEALGEACKSDPEIAAYVGEDHHIYSNYKARAVYDIMKARKADGYETVPSEKALTFRRVDPEFAKLDSVSKILYFVKKSITGYTTDPKGNQCVIVDGKTMYLNSLTFKFFIGSICRKCDIRRHTGIESEVIAALTGTSKPVVCEQVIA